MGGRGTSLSSHIKLDFPALNTEVNPGVFVPETFHQAIRSDSWLLGRQFSSSVRIKGRVLCSLAPRQPRVPPPPRASPFSSAPDGGHEVQSGLSQQGHIPVVGQNILAGPQGAVPDFTINILTFTLR